MYKAILFFKDLHDKSYEYRPGDVFPRSGLKVSQERLEELSSKNNRRGKPVIAKVEEPKPEQVEEPAVEEVSETEMPKPKRGRKKKNAD